MHYIRLLAKQVLSVGGKINLHSIVLVNWFVKLRNLVFSVVLFCLNCWTICCWWFIVVIFLLMHVLTGKEFCSHLPGGHHWSARLQQDVRVVRPLHRHVLFQVRHSMSACQNPSVHVAYMKVIVTWFKSTWLLYEDFLISSFLSFLRNCSSVSECHIVVDLFQKQTHHDWFGHR